ncbi:MAG: HPF/RaiA family ribosome-associated protein [Nocardiaceae bacterium]|nr:HPF/RaiA family ribosome-associated protein [Nocardiaceae bacterium]
MTKAHSPHAPLTVSLGHHVAQQVADYARDRLGRSIDRAPELVLDARLRITKMNQPANPKRYVGQVNIDVNGRPVRVQVQASDEWQAVDLLEAKLDRRLEQVGRHWEAIRGHAQAIAEAGEWRHADLPAERENYFPRPDEEREIVRHKSFAVADCTCDEAAFDMDLMDYDFHLFTETGSGVDSVLYRAEPTGLRLAQVRPQPDKVVVGARDVTLSSTPALEATPAQAIERLELSKMPFVSFRDSESGRGSVVYHRYDGHYGLITPNS